MTNIAYDYFKWLVRFVTEDDSDRRADIYEDVLIRLFETDFHEDLARDRNRALDGLELRREYGHETFSLDDIFYSMSEECSVLELMVALSIRLERDIMYDIHLGDRTSQWFWEMMDNLGLRWDSSDEEIERILGRFMDRKYLRDGSGGLFRTTRDDVDMRDLEIWAQANRHLNEIIGQKL